MSHVTGGISANYFVNITRTGIWSSVCLDPIIADFHIACAPKMDGYFFYRIPEPLHIERAELILNMLGFVNLDDNSEFKSLTSLD